MKILVVGSGAREHAIAWKLHESPHLTDLFVAPGNAGTASLAVNIPVQANDIDNLIRVAHCHSIDLTFVGPETPLSEGIVDRFRDEGLDIFGPTMAAAQIEASKSFARAFMSRNNIPCAQGLTFDSYQEAHRFIKSRSYPVVIKADGLAAGKGVTIANTREEAIEALDICMNQRLFGDAGARVVIEEFLKGREISVFTFTDGYNFSPLISACDYKRAWDGDRGPNTGGMGSYTPPRFWDKGMADEISASVFQPTIDGLRNEGTPFQGVLYGGLILTEDGIRVLEFNARLGDPEAPVILPLLRTDLVEIAKSILSGTLNETPISWGVEASVGIVLASQGYPGTYTTGFPIDGFGTTKKSALVFHAGTKISNGSVVSNGGRVLTVVGLGENLDHARHEAYSVVKQLSFNGSFYRGDIGL